MYTPNTFNRWIGIFYTIFLVTLVIGTPLLFSSLTRSVFEVNKLLLLRYSTLITLFLWLFHYLFLKDNNALDHNQTNSYGIGSFSWKKIGLEKIVLIWLIFNAISTIFSPNIYVSIIGAYDRWEGIITLINYMILLYMFAKLVTQKYQLFWICGGILVSTALSAYYGVLQSVGYDFMHWSADPTYRVFACINNPVHYCAYVGMVFPIGVALTLFLTTKKPPNTLTTLSPLVIKAIKSLILLVGISIYVSIFSPELFSTSFSQFLLLLGLGVFVSESLTQTHLNWQNIIKWGAFIGILFSLSAVNIITLSKFDWVAFFTILSPYVILAAWPNKTEMLHRLLFIGTNLIFYTMYLSFSRATWVGFFLATPLFFLGCTYGLKSSSQLRFIRSFFYKVGFVVSHVLLYNFDLYSFGGFPMAITLLLFLTFFLLSFYNEHNKFSFQLIYPLILMLLVIFTFHSIPLPISGSIKLILISTIMFWSLLTYQKSPLLYQLILITLFLGHLQFTSQSLINLIYFLFLAISYIVTLYKTNHSNTTKIVWILSYLLVMGIAIILPKLPVLIYDFKLLLVSSPMLLVLLVILGLIASIWGIFILSFPTHIQKKPQFKRFLIVISIFIFLITFSMKHHLEQNNSLMTQSQNYIESKKMAGRAGQKLNKNVYKNTARIAMWKSVPQWTFDYWLLGSGPDTVKFMYPRYRHHTYGILEGGHNYTPDKLHNEYFNTLTTRGITGFVIYYFGIILGWVILILKRGYEIKDSPYFYLMFAMLTGAGIYLGQVLFNFGVVATLVLFYVLMGLGWAIVTHPSYRLKNSSD